MSRNKISKCERKTLRKSRRYRLRDDYRKACREEIARLNEHNKHAVNAEDRVSPLGFRVALKRLRHEFTRAIAGLPPRVRA